LSNLLDNAIEAAAQSGTESPTVRVLIRPQQDYLFLRVTNPVRTDLPPRRVLSLHTTKGDQKLHGYGTKIIRNVAERYQGSVKFDLRDGIFLADVMLYLEEGREDG
ncbi:MAG: ATP-binding protein, partial [Clostridiales bacterium]|nr:ATP-binding protein [Clostridiales bacterium]